MAYVAWPAFLSYPTTSLPETSAARRRSAPCEANAIEAVHDLCPFMALTDAALPHRVHGFFRRRFGHAMQASRA